MPRHCSTRCPGPEACQKGIVGSKGWVVLLVRQAPGEELVGHRSLSACGPLLGLRLKGRGSGWMGQVGRGPAEEWEVEQLQEVAGARNCMGLLTPPTCL